ncbi:MAG: PilZ domain-containing protein [Nitrospiraceae bacterium]|nr:MAG: PilZ domain-containing protein [Nitrospiraceae bacterium]
MGERQHKRVIVNLQAELICGDTRFSGLIENLSEDGVYLITTSAKSPIDLAPNTALELRFQLPSGEKQSLHCVVKWSYKTPSHGLTSSIGMKIINPPETYKHSLRTLQ